MVHPDDVSALKTALDFQRPENIFQVDFRYKRGDGKFFWCRCKALKLLDDAGKPYRLICKLTDINEQKRSEKKLIDKAQRDSLTGLYNSMTTEMMIKEFLSGEGAVSRHALMVIDLDDFKKVNDQWGHRTGDEFLQTIAKKFRASVRHTDIIGRIGGDEFVILLKNIKSPEEIIETADKLRDSIGSIRLEETDEGFVPTCSIGISIYPDHGHDYTTIFRIADESLYYVKDHGKNGSRLYE
jgi:diguanylate cyclase (GGDEF)-like protein